MMHKTAVIKYSEYDKETGKVSFQDNFEDKDIGTKSQEVITEGLLDLSILDNPPEIHQGSMTSGKYHDNKNKDTSWASMNTEAWHDKITGLEGGLKARADKKR